MNIPTQIDALPEIVEAVGGRVEVFLDGGVRRGTDVLKALALGARAVFLGRPILWGLSCDVWGRSFPTLHSSWFAMCVSQKANGWPNTTAVGPLSLRACLNQLSVSRCFGHKHQINTMHAINIQIASNQILISRMSLHTVNSFVMLD